MRMKRAFRKGEKSVYTPFLTGKGFIGGNYGKNQENMV
jgi:hypothetical protein